MAYIVLPAGLALLAYRCAEAIIGIARGTRMAMIVGHEAEDLIDAHRPEREE